VHVASWQETYRGLMPDALLDGLSVERREAQWRDWLADRSGDRFVRALRVPGGDIAGFVLTGPPRDLDFADREISALYLLAAWQGAGHGRALLAAAVEGAVDRRATALGFWVLSDNVRARRFYEAAGAVAVAARSEILGGAAIAELGYRLAIGA